MVRVRLSDHLMRAVGRAHPGQMIAIGALMMTLLVAMTGLAVDVGVWLVAKSRLQRAVDAAALSVILDRPIPADTNDNTAPGLRPATAKAQAIVLSQGINGSELLEVKTGIPRTPPPSSQPRSNQFWVSAKQRVPTAFARVIGINWADINAKATSDINSFIEIPVNPVCISGVNAICDGMIGDSTMDAFGTARPPRFGDAYENPSGPWYRDRFGQVVLPNGYPYRIQIEKDYAGTLVVQGWDLDGFNRNNPHKCRRSDNSEYTPAGSPPGACDVGDSVIGDWSSLSSTGQLNPQWNDPNYGDFPAVLSNAYGAGWHKFYRIDECNNENNDYPCYDARAQTPLEFKFWSLSPSALDPWNPLPGERTDLATVTVCASGSPTDTALSGCTITYNCVRPWGDQNGCIDLVWVEIFRLDVSTLPAGADGSRSLYVDVKPLGTTKGENAYNLRSGPPPQNAGAPFGHATQTQTCQGQGRFSDGRSQMQHVNNQASCQWESGQAAANTNTKVFARRSFPFNVVAAGQTTPYRVYLGWIPKAAAGQTLRLRNYDLDSSSWDGTTCNAAHQVVYKAYFPSSGRNAVAVTNFCGSGGAHDSGTPGVTPNLVQDWSEFKYSILPLSNAFWDDGTGTPEPGFWLYGEVWQKGSTTSPFWDTGVYEVLFDRARLIN